MADDTFGTLNVEITGDYSQLQTSLNDAAQAASAGADHISDSFAHAGEAANAAESNVSELLGELGKFAGISISIEGLKDFGEEALTAFAGIQKATIALTAMEGSAAKAAETIESLEALANRDALSFPNLLEAGQRMIAFGVEAEQLPGLLNAAADAAAATGNSFDKVTNAIDRIVVSGAAGTRQLATLGLSAQNLATVMGVTADEVSADFKAMDPSERITVIEEALNKYAGVASLTAQSISGQWQQLENATHEAFVQIGSDIAPAASAIMSFAQDSVVPAVASVIQSLTSASSSVIEFVQTLRDVGVTATDFLGPLGQILSYVQRLGSSEGFPTLSQLLLDNITHWQTLQTVLGGVSLAVQTFTDKGPAVDEMNKAIAAMVGNVTHMASTTVDGYQQASGAVVAYNAELRQIVQTQTDAEKSLKAAHTALDILTAAYANHTTVLKNHVVTLEDIRRAQADVAKAAEAVTAKIIEQKDSVGALTEALNLSQLKATSAEDVYRKLNAQIDGSAKSIDLAAEAYKRAQTAAEAAGGAFATAAGQMALIDKSQAKTQALYDANTQALDLYIKKIQTGNLAAEEQAVVTRDILTLDDQLRQEATKLGIAYDNQTADMLRVNVAATQQQTALNAVATTYTNLTSLGVTTSTQQEAVAASFKTVSDDAAKLGLSVQQVGAGLQFAATGANVANPQVQALAKSLTDAYSNGVQFVTINGQMVPMLADITQGANGAASGVAKFGDELPSVTTSAADAGVSIGQTGQESLKTGESFDVTTVKVLGFVDAAHKAQAAAKALAGTSTDGIAGVTAQIIKMQTAAATGDNTLAKMTSSTQTMTKAVQDNGSVIISWTEDINGAIASLDAMEHAYNKLQTSLEGSGAGPEATSLSQLASIYNPFNTAASGPVGVQSNTTATGTNTAFGITESPLQQYLDQIDAQKAALIQQGYTIQSIAMAVAAAESTYSSTIDTSLLVQKSATAATQATTAAVTGLGTAVTATTAAVNDQMATADDAYGALNQALLAAGVSYVSLSEAQQRDITQNLQAAAAGGTTVSALNALATSLVSAATGVTSTATSIGTLGSSATTAAAAMSTAGTTVSNAAVAMAATALAVIQAVAPANAQVGNINSSTALNFGTVSQSLGAAGSNARVGTITPGTGQVVPYNNSAPLNLTVNLNGGMVVGNGGMQQLTQMVAQGVVTTLRQAGAKV